MGQKGGTTQQTSSSSGPPPQVMAEYQSLVDRATNVANQPYQPYQGEQVAPLSSQTLQGLGGISDYANAAQPYLGAAGAMTMGASSPVNPEQFQGMGSLQNFMNPYTSSVIQATQGEMNNQNQQQAQFLNSANISSGAFGGDRAGIGQSILANQQQLAEAPTIAGLNQANYNQAMSNWQNQQGVNLAAQQANAARQMSGAAQLGQIGQSTQQAGLQGSQANIQAGMIPQQQQQAIDTAAQNMYQQGQAYPFSTTGWLGSIIEGTGGLSGGQSQTTSPGPNSITQGLGAATQGIGLLGSLIGLSDERAKEDIEPIGKTYDGQNIYRYRFKGDPRTQIGLIAQEEAYHDPGSVQRIGMGDLLGIDYDRATEGAAERGHFATGGMPSVAGMPMAPQGGGGGGGGMSPSSDLMMSGDPGARMGLGSMGLLAGTSAHPTPGFDTVPLRKAGGGRVGFQGGGAPLQGAPSSALVGPNGAMGIYAGWQPGDQLGPLAGVPEALFGQESAGDKNPYTGIDFDQAMAIGQGQWMPPQTGAKDPDYGNLQNSPQFGAAEHSLAGLFGGGYTPGSTTLGAGGAGTMPAANAGGGGMGAPTTGGIVGGAPSPGASGAAGATQGGLSRGQLSDIFSHYFGGQSPSQNVAPEGPVVHGGPGAGASGGGAGGGFWRGGGATMMNRARGGRAGFAFGGFPVNDPNFSYYTPQTGNARGAAYHPPQPAPPPAIQIQRQLQGKARATAAVKHGLVRPRVIAHDPVTGQPHDITPQPDHPSTARYPGWPTPGPGGSGGGGPSPQIWPTGPTVRFGAKIPPDFLPPREQGPENAGAPPEQEFRGEPPRRIGGPPAAPEETLPSEGFNPGSILRRLPSFIGKGALRRLPFGDLVSPSDELAPPSRDEAPRWSWPKPQSPDSGPTIHAPAPGSHVTDLGTWGGEGGAGEGRDFRGPPGPFDMPPNRWAGPPPADADPDVMNMGDEGPQRFRGGRIGRQEGGNIPIGGGAGNAMEGPTGTDVNELFSGLDDHTFDQGGGGGGSPDLSNVDWEALAGGGGGNSSQRVEINPQAAASAPSFQGAGGGGGGGYRGDVTSLMGGPPITAGHFVPTTGNARGATYVPGGGGVSPNARAQAPEHPAVTIARHIMQAHHARGGGGGRGGPGGVNLGNYASVVGNHGSWPTPNTDYGAWVPPSEDYLGGENTPSGNPHGDGPPSVAQHFQGGGGVLGASPMENAGGYTPQGQGMTGATSQGEGLGSIATAGKAAGGFGDLFGGGGRAGFAQGGGPETDPFLAAISASVPQTSSGGGRGTIPAPPEAPKPPATGGGQPGGDLGDNLGKLGSAVKKFAGPQGGQQTTPTSQDASGGSGGWGDVVNTDSVFSELPDSTFDLGFQTGGGVGLGSLRGGFSDGGSPDADAETIESAVTGPPAPPVAAPLPAETAPAPATGGGGGGGGLATDRTKTTPAQRAEFYRQYIKTKYPGADPNIALGVAGAEGLNAPGVGGSTVDIEKSTGQPFSFGDFQMNIHPGALGDQALKAGYDPRDPNQWQGVGKFAIDQMYGGKGGLNLQPWKGDKYAEAYLRGQRPGVASASNVPSAGATPASAETTSYGGGFQLPGDGGPPPGRLDRNNLQAPTMGDELKHDPFGYMMTVGSAMMASRSPWLGVGIGEGFQAGNKFLEQGRELEKSWGETQAQIANLSADARLKGADIGLKAQQLQLGALGMKMKLAVMRSAGIGVDDGTGAPGATGGQGDGSGGIGTIGPLGSTPAAGGAPGGAGAAGGIGTSRNGAGPVVAGGGAGAGAPGAGAAPTGGAAPAGGLPDISSDPDWNRGKALIEKGNRINAAGEAVGMKGLGEANITEGNKLVTQAQNRYDLQKNTSQKTSEAGIEAQKPVLQEYLTNRQKFESNYDQTRSEISELSNIYQHYQSGRSAEAQAELASWANALGFKLPQAAGFDAGMKSAIQQAFAAVANSGLQKAPRAGLREATMMVASPSRDPAALRKILADQLATLDYNHELYSTVPGHNLAVGDDIESFTKTHKYEDYLKKAHKELPFFKGLTKETLKTATGEDWPAPLPPQGKAQPGERYTLPDGRIVRMNPEGKAVVEYEP